MRDLRPLAQAHLRGILEVPEEVRRRRSPCAARHSTPRRRAPTAGILCARQPGPSAADPPPVNTSMPLRGHKQRMRLAFDARMAAWGGVGTYTRELLAALVRGQDSLGIEHVLAFRAPADGFLEDSIRGCGITWREAAGSPWSPAANARLGLAARGHADVFHAPHFPVPLGFGGPLVTTIHDLIPLLAPESMPDPSKRLAFAVAVRWAVARSEVIVCVTRAAARTIADRFAVARLCVIHHGMGSTSSGTPHTEPQAGHPSISRTRTHAVRAQDPAGGQRPAPGYVLWVGAFKPHKDAPTLLAAHRLLPAEVRNRHPLVLVGDDQTAEGRRLRAELCASGDELGRRVHVLGHVAPQDLASLYESAAVFAFPSRVEGFGLPPLEAMAHGVPVVSSRAAPMPEVLGDAVAYFLPGDAEDLAARLLQVLTAKDVAMRLRSRGRARVRRYTWERAARETAAVYGTALETGRRLQVGRRPGGPGRTSVR